MTFPIPPSPSPFIHTEWRMYLKALSSWCSPFLRKAHTVRRRLGKVGLTDFWMFPIGSGIGVNLDPSWDLWGGISRTACFKESRRDTWRTCHLPVCVCMCEYLLFLSPFELEVSVVFQEKLGIHKPKKIMLVVKC